MLSVLRTTWPLLMGMAFLMVGNGMQGTLLGIRGGIEGIPTGRMSIVMASYFGGFLLGAMIVPRMIQRVGHVRVFAAIGSLISAILVMYPTAPIWEVWALLRFAIGFCFCGVYITSESWLNASTDNANRGKALSAYMMVQMLGIVAGQALLNLGDPAGFVPFVIPSVLVSLSFMPILLSRRPAPSFSGIQRMSFRRLWQVSPLGCVGIVLMGGVFSAIFGMASVWGSAAGLSVPEISAFVAAIYLGGMLVQYPAGRLSDRGDRRHMILVLSAFGALVVAVLMLAQPGILGLLLAAAFIGGVANPVYSLLVAHTNDQIFPEEMAGASAGLLFLNGFGSVSGPIITGWLMALVGLNGFWVYIGLLLAALAGYTLWRMRRRSGPAPSPGSFAVLAPSATPVAVEAATEAALSRDDPQDDMPQGGAMTPQDVNRFWLDEVGPKGWYAGGEALDARIRERFMAAWQDAEPLAASWAGTPEGALAALILTDQFPRNMFRDDARAFATDALARRIASDAIARGFDMAIPAPQRQFFYLPFEHSEALADQDRAVALFEERLPDLADNIRHAHLHRDAIAAFGRFPWRNAALGRESTSAERAVLEAGGYGAIVSGKARLPGDSPLAARRDGD